MRGQQQQMQQSQTIARQLQQQQQAATSLAAAVTAKLELTAKFQQYEQEVHDEMQDQQTTVDDWMAEIVQRATDSEQKSVARAALQGAPLGPQNLDNGIHPKSL